MWFHLTLVLLGFVQYGQATIVVQSSFPTTTETYVHAVELDESANYFMYWKFDEESITFEVHARTRGWVGFGLSPNGGMKASDIVIGWVKDGLPFLQDRYALGMEQPILDDDQGNVQLLDASENADFTMLKFKRNLVSCDPQDRTIKEGTIKIIFAWGEDDPETLMGVAYHGARQRGSKSVMLLDFGLPDVVGQADIDKLPYFDMAVNNVSLPTNRTTYWCRILELPNLGKKHHVVKVVPLIQKENLGIVHHILAFFCHGKLFQEEHGRVCWEGNMPDNATDCNTVSFAWGVGQQDFYYPAEAGLSIGAPGDPKFFHIQMHYDNPEGLSGVVDSSGLRFLYTDQLREHDTGTLIIGHSIWMPPMVIPPKSKEFQIDSYCSSECTRNSIPDDGIYVMGMLLHTHIVGSRVWTKHVRNGVELPEVGREDHYDFNYQQLRRAKTPIQVLPGDEFITSCTYNTTHRENVTYGGPGTDNEMCFNFLFYYPRISLQSCISRVQGYYPIHQMVMQKAMSGELTIDPNDDDSSVFKYLDKMEWTESDVEAFQNQIFQSHGFDETCVSEKEGNGVFGGTQSKYYPKVEIKVPWKEEGKCDVKTNTGSALAAIIHVTLLLAGWVAVMQL